MADQKKKNGMFKTRNSHRRGHKNTGKGEWKFSTSALRFALHFTQRFLWAWVSESSVTGTPFTLCVGKIELQIEPISVLVEFDSACRSCRKCLLRALLTGKVPGRCLDQNEATSKGSACVGVYVLLREREPNTGKKRACETSSRLSP